MTPLAGLESGGSRYTRVAATIGSKNASGYLASFECRRGTTLTSPSSSSPA